ncbi:hypothetical protein FRZ61_37000 [Hypericibacter adhaerens]|uniref:Uncharacterized protein n=1 Tax=Hypericibacter adhaerens TaxID=2602016 RepID=A0A5J6N225_9PROT|nr:hypothetical protein FRZ61_37000 [Hypericibacter adhaerens]
MLIAGLALFAASLALPGIVHKPDVRSNPKHGECAYAVQDDVQCDAFSFGGSGMTSCGLAAGDAAGRSFVDKQRILDYCQGWDAPVAGVARGYEILMMGWLGPLLGVFAWYAAPLMGLALLLSQIGKRIVATVLAAAALALGLQSYALKAIPFNESSMKPEDLNYVDHLGAGFYLWIAALAAFAVFCFLEKETAARH